MTAPSDTIRDCLYRFAAYEIDLEAVYDCFSENPHLVDKETADRNFFQVLVDLDATLDMAAASGWIAFEEPIRKQSLDHAYVLRFPDPDQLAQLKLEKELLSLAEHQKQGEIADADMLRWFDMHYDDLSAEVQAIYRDLYHSLDIEVALRGRD